MGQLTGIRPKGVPPWLLQGNRRVSSEDPDRGSRYSANGKLWRICGEGPPAHLVLLGATIQHPSSGKLSALRLQNSTFCARAGGKGSYALHAGPPSEYANYLVDLEGVPELRILFISACASTGMGFRRSELRNPYPWFKELPLQNGVLRWRRE